MSQGMQKIVLAAATCYLLLSIPSAMAHSNGPRKLLRGWPSPLAPPVAPGPSWGPHIPVTGTSETPAWRPVPAPVAIPILGGVAPVPAPWSVAPVPVPQTVAPGPVPKSVAPVPVIESVAPVPAVESIAPVPVPEAVAPVPSPEIVAPVAPVPENVAPVPVAKTLAWYQGADYVETIKAGSSVTFEWEGGPHSVAAYYETDSNLAAYERTEALLKAYVAAKGPKGVSFPIGNPADVNFPFDDIHMPIAPFSVTIKIMSPGLYAFSCPVHYGFMNAKITVT